MESFSTLRTFEHRGDVVYVNAYRTVLDGWNVNATVVGLTAHGEPAGETVDSAGSAAALELTNVADLVGLRFSSQEEAVAAATRISRAYLDRLGS